MGIVNVTPDSFSDGGCFDTTDKAVAHGLHLVANGADILDIGGESTRPGATRPLVREELDRVIPVIAGLSTHGATVSVDTMRAEVAEAAVTAGARIINDVSGGLADPAILRVAAEHDVVYVAMHWRAHSTQMHQHASYDEPGGVVLAVRDELAARVDAAVAAGVARERIVVDPGLGFAKSAEHNWELLRDLESLSALECPILLGSSRKSFLGTLLGTRDGPRPVTERENANVALTTVAALEGVWGLRVHDVRATSDAVRVVGRFRGVSGDGPDHLRGELP